VIRYLLLPILLMLPVCASGDDVLRVASTTSVRDSGLFEMLSARFREKTGIEIHLIAVGTGRALKLGEKGDVDVVLVHDRGSERAFMDAGYGLVHHEVMHNYFVVLGPEADPAGIAGTDSATAAFARIASTKSTFASRGDDSGTHKAELRVWRAASVEPDSSSSWYRETGSGMGATLRVAGELGAYTLSDGGTWRSHRDQSRLRILLDEDPVLFNPYGVMIVNPERHPHVETALAQQFVEWLLSTDGQRAIGAYQLAGEPLFIPNTAGNAASSGEAPAQEPGT